MHSTSQALDGIVSSIDIFDVVIVAFGVLFAIIDAFGVSFAIIDAFGVSFAIIDDCTIVNGHESGIADVVKVMQSKSSSLHMEQLGHSWSTILWAKAHADVGISKNLCLMTQCIRSLQGADTFRNMHVASQFSGHPL